jgi:hypothetical protein
MADVGYFMSIWTITYTVVAYIFEAIWYVLLLFCNFSLFWYLYCTQKNKVWDRMRVQLI